MSKKINISLYTEEERKKVWIKEFQKRYDFIRKNVDERIIEDDNLYIYYLEEQYYKLSQEVMYYKKLSEKTEYWRYKAHVYKIELGRCVRKLTRIYQEVLAIGYLLHYIYGNESSPKNLVDSFKCL